MIWPLAAVEFGREEMTSRRAKPCIITTILIVFANRFSFVSTHQ